MEKGLYEQLLSRRVQTILSELPARGLAASLSEIDAAERVGVLTEAFSEVLRRAMRDAAAEQSDGETALYNRLLQQLSSLTSDEELCEEAVVAPASQLRLVWPEGVPEPSRPESPLRNGTLLTGTRKDPSLVSQLRKEMETADEIDILCSFIKWGGIRVLEDDLRRFCNRGSTCLRIITTSYLGATDLKAVEFLRQLPNTTVRVSYDTHRTRLHAKAYIIKRRSGFGSAYIGSANLSQAALTDGLEWTVKVSQYEQPYLWQKATATFETYFSDSEFEVYQEDDRERLDTSLKSERGGQAEDRSGMVQFDLRPYAFQQEILERIAAERQSEACYRHLVVAATGTGKTMIAAFDYRNWCRSGHGRGDRPGLLFVAHREEILKQSLTTFRAVLRDQNFGDLLVGGAEPDGTDHLFASIQSYNSRELWRRSPDHYGYVVVDEFHHAAAESYRRLLDHVRPSVLLGLTATPERGDGFDVRSYFGGHVTAEIRLADAVNRKLLVPFQYFGVTDSEDLSGLRWSRGAYRVSDLNDVFTGNDIRAQLVIQKTNEKVLDIRQARGLGFCVSVAHALFMARKFREAGIPAEALSAECSDGDRRTIQDRLRRRDINFIFVVDLYNEGVDIPEVDTILLLRPTESLTVYLQQLGRGLRLSDGKDCLTVLDFIGQAHQSFRFDVRFRGLLTDPSLSVRDEIETGFPHLPAGCSVQLERFAKQYVLENITRAIRQGRSVLVQELREMTEFLGRVPKLGEFLDRYQLEPDDIYRRQVCWSRICVEAGVMNPLNDPDEERLTRGLRRLQHINSLAQIRSLHAALESEQDTDRFDEPARRHLIMAHYSLWGRGSGMVDLNASFRRLRANPALCHELLELLAYRVEQTEFDLIDPDLIFPCPLQVHGAYTRDEIFAGLGHWTFSEQPEMREGVLHLPALKADAFLFTLDKNEKDYSPTTMYEDYAISETLIHWQSQSRTSTRSPTGQRYIRHRETGHTILLFARERSTSVTGLTNPFFFLGPADYVGHEGERPISITWKLRHALPTKLYRSFARLAIA